MKNILIIGAGAMGSAFSVPCVENNNNVSLMGTHLEDSLIETIKSKNNFHPKLNVNLPSKLKVCLLYTSPSPRDKTVSRMPSSA